MVDRRINKNSPVPAYYQIQRQIREQIEKEFIKPRQKLPAERDISETYGVSRMTARKAVRGLINEGLCTKIVGRGVFVASEKIPMILNHLEGTGVFFQRAGISVTTEIIVQEYIFPDSAVIRHLNITSTERCLYLARVRYVEETPVMLEQAYVHPSVFNEETGERIGESLYETIARTAGVEPGYARGEFNIGLAGEWVAQMLDVPLDFALLVKKVDVFARGGSNIEYNITTYRPDKFTFLV